MQSSLFPLASLLLVLAACSDDESNPRASAAGSAGSAGQAQGGAGGSPGGQGGAGASQSFQELRSEVAFDTTPDIDEGQKAAFVGGNNAFGFDLYREVIKSPDVAGSNVFLSPLSVSFALGMTSAGAKGGTLDELTKGLHFTLPQAATHAGFNWLKSELMSRPTEVLALLSDEQKKSFTFDFNLVNSLWVQKGFEPAPAFLDLLAKEYNAGLTLQDFASDPEGSRGNINGWVEKETSQRIKDLLPKGSITSETPFVLVNAVSLGAPWQDPFIKSATRDAPFTGLDGSQIEVPMMMMESSGVNLAYLSDDEVEAAQVPLLGGKLSVTLVAPKSGKFAAVEASMDAAKFAALGQAMKQTRVSLGMPRFRFTSSSVSLLEPLKALGVSTAFSDAADFSGISTSTQVKLSDVIHKAMVAFDEEGIEAAAATAVVGGGISLGLPSAIPFVVDRPFFLAIQDVTGAVLFWGRIVKPEGG